MVEEGIREFYELSELAQDAIFAPLDDSEFSF